MFGIFLAVAFYLILVDEIVRNEEKVAKIEE